MVELLDAGARVNARTTTSRRTALMLAASNGHTEEVRVLLERGADASLIDSEGNTALALALAKERPDAARMLREASTRRR